MSGFPSIVYRSPGAHFGPNGKTYSYRGVADEDEMARALADGWFATLPDACSPPQKPVEPVEAPIAAAPAAKSASDADEAPVPADDAPPTRAELKAKAAELGLEFDGRISDAKLIALIDAAVAAKE